MSNNGLRLKSLRTSKNVMAKDLAQLLQIGYRTYQKYETGEIDPPTSKTIALADFFDVSIDYLVGRTDNPEVNK